MLTRFESVDRHSRFSFFSLVIPKDEKMQVEKKDNEMTRRMIVIFYVFFFLFILLSISLEWLL